MATATKSFDFDYAFAPFSVPAVKSRPSFFRRLYVAMLESRRIAAERELRRHEAFFARLESGARKSDLPF